MNIEIILIVLTIPAIMGIGDVIVEEVVKCFSRYKKPKNETRFLIDSIVAIIWIQFVNLGFILIFMSLKLDNEILHFL